MGRLGFKKKAQNYQQWYRENEMGVPNRSSSSKDVNLLREEDAANGLNFYQGFDGKVLEEVNKERPLDKPKTIHSNILRSEHIPYNQFIPVRLSKDLSLTVTFLNELFPHADIHSISRVAIEYPSNKRKYMQDNTSFDAFIGYIDSKGGKGALGIEVKYTEKDYPYGKTEKERMHAPDKDSVYHTISKEAGLYKEGSFEALASKKLKQFWRNHLLGERMRMNGEFDSFIYAHFYPKGNDFQRDESEAYQKLLADDRENSFTPITYETYIATGRKIYQNKAPFADWLDYLEERYIVREEVI